jgi:CHASE3 domain sensor protein
MGESSEDRRKLRRQIAAQRRWIVALTIAVVAGLPMIAVVFARVVYVIVWGTP